MNHNINISDLNKIRALIESSKIIPTDAELWVKHLNGSATESENEKLAQVFGLIKNIKTELRAFVKVKLGNNKEYINRIENVGFHPTVLGLAIITSNHDEYHKAWIDSKISLRGILNDIEAEVRITLGAEISEYESLRLRQKKELRLQSFIVFWSVILLLLFSINYFFMKECFAWGKATVNPFTWIDSDKYGKGELIIGVFWISPNTYIIFNCLNWWTKFRDWFFQKYRVK